MNPEKKAFEFIQNEKEFHLGFLVTEQRHPATAQFSETVQQNTPLGLKQLLTVDRDLITKARELDKDGELKYLSYSIEQIARAGQRICFSGCGSTGRLGILLESMWRRFWGQAALDFPDNSALYAARADTAYSIMTGGDRALIKSVESFEDFQRFGRQQVVDADFSAHDLVIAISEGGETSSVIGTAWEAVEQHCNVFFIFNNPASILEDRIQRCREILQDTRVTKIDLTTGPMALSGSTRMQATSMELFVVGSALEQACCRLIQQENPCISSVKYQVRDYAQYVIDLSKMLDDLIHPLFIDNLSRAVDTEVSVYQRNGFITYLSDVYLLDIFSDTTERSPTFMLPPLRKYDDHSSPNSWAYAKDPLRDTGSAWHHMLQRNPRGLSWDAGLYREMDAPASMIDNPPVLGLEEILSYRIGCERDPSREKKGFLIYIDFGDDRSDRNRDEMNRAFSKMSQAFESGGTIIRFACGEQADDSIVLPVDLPQTGMYLFYHLAFKLSFNAVSTASMGKLGRIRGNYMIQVDATNKKLIDRASRIIRDLKGVDYQTACTALFTSMDIHAGRNRRNSVSHVMTAMDLIDKANI